MSKLHTFAIAAMALGAGALVGCADMGRSSSGSTQQAQATSGGQTYTANLSGQQEVPPTSSSARGETTATYDSSTKTLRWRVNYSGLSGPPTMAHFHGPAAPGSNAPPVIWLSPQGQPVPNPIEGSQQISDQQAADLAAGKWYANIHTQANPGGEIRGQVMPQAR
jgi:CHRD domain